MKKKWTRNQKIAVWGLIIIPAVSASLYGIWEIIKYYDLKELESRVSALERKSKKIPQAETKEDIKKQWSQEEKAEFKLFNKEYKEIMQQAEKINATVTFNIDARLSQVSISLYLTNYLEAKAASSTIHIEYPDNTAVMREKGLAHLMLGEHNEAEQMFKKALAKDEEKFGPNHPSVAINLINLADVFRETGRKEEADKKYRRALKIFEDNNNYGLNHPMTKLVWKKLKGLKE